MITLKWVVISVLLPYLLASMVMWGLNPGNWPDPIRGFTTIGFLVLAMLTVPRDE